MIEMAEKLKDKQNCTPEIVTEIKYEYQMNYTPEIVTGWTEIGLAVVEVGTKPSVGTGPTHTDNILERKYYE